MRMAPDHQRPAYAAEHASEVIVGRRREDEVVERARRAVKAECALTVLERQLDLRDVLAQNRAVAVGELVGPEGVDLVQDREDLVLRRRRWRPLDKPFVPV